MDTRTLRKLINQYLVPAFPEFTLSSREADLFMVPMNHLYRGFMFSGSSYSKASFRVNAATIPLYVPTAFFHVTFGERLRHANTDVWEWSEADEASVFASVEEAIRTQGMARIGKIQSPLDFARIESTSRAKTSINTKEAVAYSLIFAELYQEALSRIDELRSELELLEEPVTEWGLARMSRVNELLGLLKQDPQQAKSRLLEWEEQSIKNLKLEKYSNC